MKKICLILAAILLLWVPGALGLSITRTGTELATGTFSNTSITADAVVLGTTGRTLWPGIDGSGVLVKSVAADAHGLAIAGDGSGGVFSTWKQFNPSISKYMLVVGYVPFSGSLSWITGESSDPATVEADGYPRITKSIKDRAADGAIVVWARAGNLAGAKVKTDQTIVWTSSRVCTAENVQNDPELASDDNGGAIVVWRDYRNNYSSVFAQKLTGFGSQEWTNNGIKVIDGSADITNDAPHVARISNNKNLIVWQRNDVSLVFLPIDDSGAFLSPMLGFVSNLTGEKRNWVMRSINLPAPGAIVAYDNGTESVSDVYAQRLDSTSWSRLWGKNGVTLEAQDLAQWHPAAACLPDGKTMFAWFDISSGTYEAHFQKLSAYGTPEWGSDKISTEALVTKLDTDGAGGAYGSGTDFSYVPRVYRIDGNGNMLWGNSGIPVSALSYYHYRTGEALPIIASDDGDGAIIGWVSQSGLNTNVYVQKVGTRFFAGGVYTGEQVQNTDTRFASWGNITWESTDTLTAEVRTAVSLAALNSASWTPATNGGSIPSNGNCIQSRFYFASPVGSSTPSLRSFSMNYSIDTAYPSIESVKADAVTLGTSTTTDIAPSPTIEATLTDDQRINSADIKVDNVSVSYSTVSSTDTRWVIRSTITTPLSAGSHTIKVEVIDSAGNNTTNTYNVAVASRAEVKSGSIAGFSEGSKITVAYELSLPIDVTVEIRDLTGALVQKFVVPGGGVGSNSVSVERGSLGKGAYIVIITPAGGSPVSGTAVF